MKMRTLVALAIALSAVAVRADIVWITSSTGTSALPRQNVKVTGIRDGMLVFTSSTGTEASRELAQVARLQLDGEPAFSAAEEAFSTGKFDAAVDSYRRTMDATTKDWLKTFSAQRLVQSAQKVGRFDAAVAGFLALVRADPQVAAQFKPPLPQAASPQLTAAMNDVKTALADTKLAPSQRQILQAFLLELQRLGGDTQAAAQTAEKMLQTNAAGTDATATAASAALAKLKLDAAAKALAANDFATAQREIDTNRRIFIDRNDQAQAMFVLAEAQFGLAAQRNDPAALQDAALAYMRVVAHFKEPPASPLVPRALLRTAEIHEKLNDRAAARALYQQIAQQYANDPAAAAANSALQRLN